MEVNGDVVEGSERSVMDEEKDQRCSKELTVFKLGCCNTPVTNIDYRWDKH